MAIAFDANLGNVTNAATLTTSAAAAAGSRVIMFVWWFGNLQTCTGATGGGLTWVVDHQFEGSGGGDQHCAILSADAPAGLASSTVLTPTFSAGPDFGPGIAAASFTGMATGASGYVDTTSAGKDDFSETWTTNNLVTTNADDLLVAFSAVDSASVSHTATAPAIEIHEWTVEGTQRGATVYRIVSSASTYTIGGTWASSVSFQQNIGVAYKAAAEGGGDDDVGYQRLVGPLQLAVSPATLYTVPTGCRVELRSVYVNNPSGSEREVTFSIGTDAAGTRWKDQWTVPAGESVQGRRMTNHILTSGETIEGFCDSASTVVAQIDGYLEAL